MGSGKVICTMAEDAKIPVEAVHVVSAAFSWMDRRGVEHGVQSQIFLERGHFCPRSAHSRRTSDKSEMRTSMER
jgi:hypothetical protein